MTTEHVSKKLESAEYHRTKLDSSDSKVIEHEFAAFLAAWRSIVMYVEHHLQLTEPEKEKRWVRIHAWEDAHLDSNESEQWKSLVHLRNEDIHVEPVTSETIPGSFWGLLSFGRIAAVGQSMGPRFIVNDSKTGKRYEVRELCDTGLDCARRMIADIDKI